MGVIDSQVEVMEDCHKEIPGGGFHCKWSIDSIPSIHSIAWQVKLVVVGYMVLYTLGLRWWRAGVQRLILGQTVNTKGMQSVLPGGQVAVVW